MSSYDPLVFLQERVASIRRLRTAEREFDELTSGIFDYGEKIKKLVSKEEQADISDAVLKNVPEDFFYDYGQRYHETLDGRIELFPPEQLKDDAELFERYTAILRQNLKSVPTIEQLKQRKVAEAKSIGEIGLRKNLPADVTRHLTSFAVGDPTTLNTGDVQAQREGVSLAPRAVPPLNRTKHNEGGRRKTRKHKTRKSRRRR